MPALRQLNLLDIINDANPFSLEFPVTQGGIYDISALAETVSGSTIGQLVLQVRPANSSIWTTIDKLPLNEVGAILITASFGLTFLRMFYLSSNISTPDTKIFWSVSRKVIN